VTAPDPLECLNARAAAGRPTCDEPASAHCEACQSCPGTCICRDTTVGLTGHELALRSDLRQTALDGYSVVFEGSKKLVRDHHKAIDAAIAATLIRLADEHERLTNGERCCGPAPEPQCLRCGPGDETAAWLRVTAHRLDPDYQRRMKEDV
jgi:hypothetical protein